jgi:hypothetical protein
MQQHSAIAWGSGMQEQVWMGEAHDNSAAPGMNLGPTAASKNHRMRDRAVPMRQPKDRIL